MSEVPGNWKTVSGRVVPGKSAIEYPKHSKAQLLALKALAAGNANEHQQQMALGFIVMDLCGTYDWPYRPDEDGTLLSLGKQWVGKRIVHLVEVAKPDDKE